MKYRVLYGLEAETLEAVRQRLLITHISLDNALLEALITEDAGPLIVFEMTSEDGKCLDRQQIKKMLVTRRAELLRKLPAQYRQTARSR
jgi:hypothetical protein